MLLDMGANPSIKDKNNNTVLHLINLLLDQQRYSESLELAQILLRNDQMLEEINLVNNLNKTILAYSVTHGDKNIELSRLLINNGALIYPEPEQPNNYNNSNAKSEKSENEIVEIITKEHQQSVFKSFLAALMEHRDLDDMKETLDLLCHTMAVDDNPSRMKKHVLRAMLIEGKAFNAHGPLFIRLKRLMAPYWSRPLTLKYSCMKQIRRSMGPKRLSRRGTSKLSLPGKLQKYIMYHV